MTETRNRREDVANWRRQVGWLLSVAALGYFFWFAHRHWGDLERLDLPSTAYVWVLVAGVAWAAAMFAFSALPWVWLVESVGHCPGRAALFRVYALAQIGKYLPGNFAHQLGRIELSARIGFDRRDVAWIAVVEVVLTVAAAASQGAAALLMAGGTLIGPAGIPSELSVSGVSLAAVSIPIFTWFIVNQWRPKMLDRLLGGWKVPLPPIGVFLRCYALYWLAALAMATVLALSARYVLDASGPIFWPVFAVWVVSWIVGFIAPGAPAGLGVREAVFVSGLSGWLGPDVAIALTMMQRLVTVLGDAFVFALGLVLARGGAVWEKSN